MANLSGTITTNVWTETDDHVITEDIIVNLTEDFNPTGTITSIGTPNITFTATSPVTVNLTRITISSEIGSWIISDNVTLHIAKRDNLGPQPTSENLNFLQINGGTFRIKATGTDADVIFGNNSGISVTQEGTIILEIDDMTGSSTTVASGGVLRLHNLTGPDNSIINITGGDNHSYVPLLILTGNNNDNDIRMNIERGTGVEFVNSHWGGQIYVRGHLKGTGDIDGHVYCFGGSIGPGNEIGDQLIFNEDLELENNSNLYFSYDIDENGNYKGDMITVSGNVILRSANIITIPHTHTINNISNGPFTLITTGAVLNTESFDLTNNYINLNTHTDIFNHTASIRRDDDFYTQNIVLELS